MSWALEVIVGSAEKRGQTVEEMENSFEQYASEYALELRELRKRLEQEGQTELRGSDFYRSTE